MAYSTHQQTDGMAHLSLEANCVQIHLLYQQRLAKYSVWSIWNTKYKILYVKYLKYQNTKYFLICISNTKIPNMYFKYFVENTKYRPIEVL